MTNNQGTPSGLQWLALVLSIGGWALVIGISVTLLVTSPEVRPSPAQSPIADVIAVALLILGSWSIAACIVRRWVMEGLLALWLSVIAIGFFGVLIAFLANNLEWMDICSRFTIVGAGGFLSLRAVKW